MSKYEELWSGVLNTLQENISEQGFNTWFNETEVIELDDNKLSVKVPTQFIADYLNSNYSELVSEICFNLFKNKYHIRFTGINPARPEKKYIIKSQSKDIATYQTKLNKNYNFNEFVIGTNNSFAHSASLAVAESPGTTYNPLFIYGESGMGKTHLMQAVGNFVMDEMEDKKVFYITTEEFTNEMIDNIRNNSMPSFRNKFRNFDVLLIDDIHFLSKKEGTQEEFFHTFNALYEKKKQIVLTSDRPPKDIPDLEKRLVTRFEWGLLADLKSPDFETRVAILKKKAEFEEILLKDEVIEFIAEHIYSNVRALEGSLIRILAFSSYNNLNTEDITVDDISEILIDMISDKIKEVNLETIMQKVCAAYNISPAQIFDKTRKKNIVFPRQIAMYLSNLLITQLSLKEIAEYYKRKDHTTVLHAKKTIEKQFKEDRELRIMIEKLIKEIKG
ncbi:MAG: chromosomal replication initiator protein DnaA [Candidatus Tenebribacter burtonii]|jgi:chromosomal replication initiator protein|nr:chromosomal replication initiator protein DnaA [Candidatus Tenebribacter burtonii]